MKIQIFFNEFKQEKNSYIQLIHKNNHLLIKIKNFNDIENDYSKQHLIIIKLQDRTNEENLNLKNENSFLKNKIQNLKNKKKNTNKKINEMENKFNWIYYNYYYCKDTQ